MLNGIAEGLTTALAPINLAMVLAGCLIGTLIGMIPGLGPITAIALMIPLTYELDPSSALILMAGVYYGAVFGGSTTSILLNAPGEASSVATAFDGHPLARQGHAGKALAIAAYASFAGGTVAAVLLLVAAPALAAVALTFHSPDYFAIAVLAIGSVSAFAATGQLVRGLMMVVLGLMLATVGQDVASDVPRFTFGTLELLDGIDFLLLAMAIFALSEALLGVLRPELGPNDPLAVPCPVSPRCGSIAARPARSCPPWGDRRSSVSWLASFPAPAPPSRRSWPTPPNERSLPPPSERSSAAARCAAWRRPRPRAAPRAPAPSFPFSPWACPARAPPPSSSPRSSLTGSSPGLDSSSIGPTSSGR
jgi:hypothetical protein